MKGMDNLQDEFILDKEITYLNHAAVAPWPRSTRDAVIAFAEENTRLGSRNYLQWMKVEQDLRELLARLINTPTADDIALLKNTSEALSVVAYGINWQPGDNIVISDQEFPSNRIVWESLADQGVQLRQVDLDTAVTPEQALIQACDERTRMLAISWVQYASGLRMDLHELGEFCRNNNILYCIDAIQGIGALQLDVQDCNADFVMADGHKWMLGPEGVALFYVRPELRERLQLKQYGWHMIENHMDFDVANWQAAHSARRFECGSPNMLGIHALHASINLLLTMGMAEVEQRLLDNSRYLMQQIQTRPELELITRSDEGRFAGIVTFRHQQHDSQQLYQDLMAQQVMCAYRGGGIRFSPHFYNTHEQIDRALALVCQ